jgi:hypothetical protein
MKEWVLVDHAKPSSYKNDLALFQEAITFVSAGSEASKSKK